MSPPKRVLAPSGGGVRALGLDVYDRDVARFRSMKDPAIIAPIFQLAQPYVAGLDLERMLK